jgi:hypothetical protein
MVEVQVSTDVEVDGPPSTRTRCSASPRPQIRPAKMLIRTFQVNLAPKRQDYTE